MNVDYLSKYRRSYLVHSSNSSPSCGRRPQSSRLDVQHRQLALLKRRRPIRSRMRGTGASTHMLEGQSVQP